MATKTKVKKVTKPQLTQEQNEKLLAQLYDVYNNSEGKNSVSRCKLEVVLERYGLKKEEVISFLNGKFMKDLHSEERKICLGVIEFYDTYPDMPQQFQLPYTTENRICLADFILMTHAETRHIQKILGVKCETASLLLNQLMPIDSDKASRALKRRSEKHTERQDARDLGWMRKNIHPDKMNRLLSGKVMYPDHELSIDESLKALSDGYTLVYGKVSLSKKGKVFTGYKPYTDTTFESLKKNLNDVQEAFNKNRNNRQRFLKCDNSPFRIVDTDYPVKNGDVYVCFVNDFTPDDYVRPEEIKQSIEAEPFSKTTTTTTKEEVCQIEEPLITSIITIPIIQDNRKLELKFYVNKIIDMLSKAIVYKDKIASIYTGQRFAQLSLEVCITERNTMSNSLLTYQYVNNNEIIFVYNVIYYLIDPEQVDGRVQKDIKIATIETDSQGNIKAFNLVENEYIGLYMTNNIVAEQMIIGEDIPITTIMI